MAKVKAPSPSLLLLLKKPEHPILKHLPSSSREEAAPQTPAGGGRGINQFIVVSAKAPRDRADNVLAAAADNGERASERTRRGEGKPILDPRTILIEAPVAAGAASYEHTLLYHCCCCCFFRSVRRFFCILRSLEYNSCLERAAEALTADAAVFEDVLSRSFSASSVRRKVRSTKQCHLHVRPSVHPLRVLYRCDDVGNNNNHEGRLLYVHRDPRPPIALPTEKQVQ